MAEIRIKSIEIKDNKYILDWDCTDTKHLNKKKVTVAYDFTLPENYELPTNMIFAFLAPVMALEHDEIDIYSPYPVSGWILDYWLRYTKLIFPDRSVRLNLKEAQNEPEKSEVFNESPLGRAALMFGGGVESTFAISKIYHTNPVLISIIGERWMNNDTSNAAIKFDIERQLCEDYNLNMQRVETDLRSVFTGRDSFANKYSTGAQFYFFALPIANKFRLHSIYKGHELEAALNFTDHDLSLHSRFMVDLTVQRPNYPVIFPMFNAYSKIQMVEDLGKSGFLKYIYSCSHNSDKRWCGQCGKCYRISRYLEALGIDKSVIGMQEGIVGKREHGSTYDNYWGMMDKLYGRKYFKDIKNHIAFKIKKLRKSK